jgi:hypothetical protein
MKLCSQEVLVYAKKSTQLEADWASLRNGKIAYFNAARVPTHLCCLCLYLYLFLFCVGVGVCACVVFVFFIFCSLYSSP